MKETGLLKHIQSKHSEDEEQIEDNAKNYCCTALCLGLLTISFNEARKYGDGEKIIVLYKFMVLIFKLAGKNKYALYGFQLLCQVPSQLY